MALPDIFAPLLLSQWVPDVESQYVMIAQKVDLSYVMMSAMVNEVTKNNLLWSTFFAHDLWP